MVEQKPFCRLENLKTNKLLSGKCVKKVIIFPGPSRDVTYKHSMAGNY
jgi:hypothetical protein